jgi:hypothetical protein
MVRNYDDSLEAQCPAHEDNDPSLSMKDNGEGRALIHCHAGCDPEDVMKALDLTLADLYDNRQEVRYTYDDGRVVHRGPDKAFSQSGDRATVTLYRRERVIAAVARGETIYVVEGEADVHAVERAGGTATTSPMGAGKWPKVDATPLAGATVVVVQDRDDPGRKHAAQVVESLLKIANSVRLVEASDGKDATDHLTHHGHQLTDFVAVEMPTVVARRSRITWASTIKPKPVVWGWTDGQHGRVPTSALTLVAGREGTGKSSFGIEKASQLTQGTLTGAHFGRPRKVLYVAVEDSWEQTIVPRLMAAGADLSMVGRFEVVETGELVALSLPVDNALLEKEVAENDVAAVFLDPLMSAMGSGLDTHIEREVRSALEPLAAMAQRTGCMVMCIAHFNKSSSSDLNNLITASGAFKNVARAVLSFGYDESGGVMTQSKNSLGRGDLPSLSYVLEAQIIQTDEGPTETSRFRFIGESDRTVRDVLRDSREDPDEHTERHEGDQWLRDYLVDGTGPFKAAEVIAAAKAAGFTENRIKKSRQRIKATSDRIGFGKDAHYVWALPMDARPMGAMESGARSPEPMASMKAAPMEETEVTAPGRDGLCRTCGGPTEHAAYIYCAGCNEARNTKDRKAIQAELDAEEHLTAGATP